METLRNTFEKTTEDAFINALLGLSVQHAPQNPDIATLNNELTTQYNILNTKREYNRITPEEYAQSTENLLYKYNLRYKKTFQQAELTNASITRNPNSALYRFSAGNLFNAITNHGNPNQSDPEKVDKRKGKPLTIEMIIEGAKLHKKKTGKWPGSNNRKIIEDDPLAGEKWFNIDYDLRNGLRDLPLIKGGLPQFLREHGCYNERKTTEDDVLISMLNYRKKHKGEWPDQRTPEKIEDGTILNGKSWGAIDVKTPLYQIRLKYEKTYTKQDVLNSIANYKQKNNGKRPNNKMTTKIDDGTKLSGYTWLQIDKMRIEGLTLSQIIKEQENLPITYQDIAEPLNDYRKTNDGEDPTYKSEERISTGRFKGKSWKQLNKILSYKENTTLAKLIDTEQNQHKSLDELNSPLLHHINEKSEHIISSEDYTAEEHDDNFEHDPLTPAFA